MVRQGSGITKPTIAQVNIRLVLSYNFCIFASKLLYILVIHHFRRIKRRLKIKIIPLHLYGSVEILRQESGARPLHPALLTALILHTKLSWPPES